MEKKERGRRRRNEERRAEDKSEIILGVALREEMVERWRPAGCATSFLTTTTTSATTRPQTKLYIKFIIAPHGYEAFVSDFKGHLWRERLENVALQDRLKSEASGLEIESGDLLKLLDQMTQNIVDSSSEISSDSTSLILRTSVKVGFIKLKWTFKTGLCSNLEHHEMMLNDFLMPFFGNLREDKSIKDEIEGKELNCFYETILPNLKQQQEQRQRQEEQITINSPDDYLSLDSFEPKLTDSEMTMTPPLGEVVVNLIPSSMPPDLEETKRRQLEEALQANKNKKKKKLI